MLEFTNFVIYRGTMKFIFVVLIFFTTQFFANDLKKVSLQLEWKHQFEFAGFYMAKEKGFYKDIGLDVEFKEYQHGVNISADVATEISTFGVNYPTIILDKAKGYDVVLLSAILQASPHVLITLDSSKIQTLSDFRNITLMTEDNAKNSAHFISMFQSQNISFNEIKKIPHTFDINDLLKGNVDAASIFLSNEPYILDKQGIKYTIWDPKDYGFDFYDLILFTSSKLAKTNPKMVEEFNNASLKGWKYAFDHIEESSDVILKKYNTQNKTKEHLIFEGKTLKKMAYYKTNQLGKLDKLKIQRIIDMYNVLGLIQNKINLNSILFEKSFLNQEETNYLNKRDFISFCIDPSWMPFEAFDKNGNYTGMSSDYMKFFSEILNTRFEIVKTENWNQSLEFAQQRKCDILPLAMETPLRKEYLNFTTAYLKVPLVIATKMDTPFIDNLNALQNKKISIPKGYAFVEILRKNYPNLEIVEVENVEEGLERVNTNSVFGYVGTLPDVGYQFQTKFNGELKIAGKFDEYWELSVAVRNDDVTLFNIMQKAVNSLNPKQQQTILNDWVSVKYEKSIDYTLIIEIILITVLISLTFIYWNRKLSNSKKQLELLNRENKRYLDMINKNVLVSTCDTRGYITDVSEALCDLSGYSKQELIGQNHNIFRHPDMPDSIFKDMWTTIVQGKVWHGEIKNLIKNGSYYWSDVIISPKFDNQQQLIGYTAIRQNITDRKQLEITSITDPLTKVFNRLYLDQTYKSEYQRALRYKKDFSVILIDIDFFKQINDTHGHNVGDMVLKDVANILKENIRINDKLGRWGGEEFLIICPETPANNAQILAENLRKTISNHNFPVIKNLTCSLGVTMFNINDEKDETFIRADKALYLAKDEGRNKVVVA